MYIYATGCGSITGSDYLISLTYTSPIYHTVLFSTPRILSYIPVLLWYTLYCVINRSAAYVYPCSPLQLRWILSGWEKNHMFGKPRPEGAGSPAQKIEVLIKIQSWRFSSIPLRQQLEAWISDEMLLRIILLEINRSLTKIGIFFKKSNIYPIVPY